MKAQSNRRQIDLNLPIVLSATLTRRRFLAGTGVILTSPFLITARGAAGVGETRKQPANTTRVHFQLVDAQTGQTTPAMACISNASSGEVRLPPDGRVATQPSSVQQFFSGVKYDPDPNWVGPVRKMQGQGNNNDRSYVYENRPSIPYWTEPVIYQTSGHFVIDLPAGRWRIRASHGMEYVPVTDEFELTGRGELEKTLQLQRWIDLPALGWWSGDVHVHHPSAQR